MLLDWQLRWNISEVGRYTFKFFQNISLERPFLERNLFLFLTNHGPFASHLYQINVSNSTLCICGKWGDSLHYIFSCPLTKSHHLKKHRNMSLENWLKYIINHPKLLNRISRCIQHIASNEDSFLNPAPYFN